MKALKQLEAFNFQRVHRGSSKTSPTVESWKRVLDLTLLFFGAPLFLVLFAILLLWALLCGQRKSLLFQQTRIGQHKLPFKILKVRTMVDGDSLHNSHLEKLVVLNQPMKKIDEDHPEVFLPGARLIRASGLDELPQLLNIWRGEMSFVGPRPCLPHEIAFFEGECQSRFHVLPGLTGKWQVCGKNELTFKQMLVCDRHYVKNSSLERDLVLIARTPGCLVRQIRQHLSRLRIAKSSSKKIFGRSRLRNAA